MVTRLLSFRGPICSNYKKMSGDQVIPDDQIPGVERVYVHDPFGNRIELISAE